MDCHAFAQTDLHTPRRGLRDLPLNPYHGVHLVTPPLITGVYGVQWAW